MTFDPAHLPIEGLRLRPVKGREKKFCKSKLETNVVVAVRKKKKRKKEKRGWPASCNPSVPERMRLFWKDGWSLTLVVWASQFGSNSAIVRPGDG